LVNGLREFFLLSREVANSHEHPLLLREARKIPCGFATASRAQLAFKRSHAMRLARLAALDFAALDRDALGI